MYDHAVPASVASGRATTFLSHLSRSLLAQVLATSLSARVKVPRAQRLATVAHMLVAVHMVSSISVKTVYGRYDLRLLLESKAGRGADHRLFLPHLALQIPHRFHLYLAMSLVRAVWAIDTSIRRLQCTLLMAQSTLLLAKLVSSMLSLHP
jgi:hypothetical protein